MTKPQEDVADGGWGWLVLLGAFTGQLLISGTCANLGVYLVEWQEYFEVSAAAVSIIATEVMVLLHGSGNFLSISTSKCKKRPGVATTISGFWSSWEN